ncbi:MAG: RNA polymerase sigma factor [Bacteroidales bacterium]|nr:RNA polymerase sigma factor [Bacteroidales bacterium]
MRKKVDSRFIDTINENAAILHKIGCMYCDTNEDREDLKQEILFQLWKSFPKFKGQSAVSTWIYRVALNTAITFLKKEQRDISKIEPCPVLMLVNNNEEDEQLTERLSAMHQAIGKLSNVDKALVTLYLENKSYEEISEIMGISQVNARVKLNRIKERLKKLMKN